MRHLFLALMMLCSCAVLDVLTTPISVTTSVKGKNQNDVDAKDNRICAAYEFARAEIPQGDVAVNDPIAAFSHYYAAATQARGALDEAAAQKKTGQWRPGLRYEISKEGVLTEDVILAKLTQLADDASKKAAAVEPQVVAVWKSKYGASSAIQIGKIKQLGEPTLVSAACWTWEGDELDHVVCWRGGAVASERDQRSPRAIERERRALRLASYVTAAVFASGRCDFGNCMKDGWTRGAYQSRCSFGNCLKDGWSTSGPQGQSQTRCNFGNCSSDGWTTTHPSGEQSQTRCNFGHCFSDGWTTTLPDGSQIQTRCNFGKCTTDGWTTTLPDGDQVSCRCSFGDCLTNGADCG
jgi:hypothetical protein